MGVGMCLYAQEVTYYTSAYQNIVTVPSARITVVKKIKTVHNLTL